MNPIMSTESFESLFTVNPSTRYWLVRSNNGEYYNAFHSGGYIAIGWNHIAPESILDLKLNQVTKSKIEEKENEERRRVAQENHLPYKPVTKSQVNTIYKKLRSFLLLSAGDIIIVPSHRSDKYLIGSIVDNTIYTDQADRSCPYYKRRKVEWLAEKSFYQIPPSVRKIKNVQHTISEIDENLHEAIQSLIRPLFVFNGSTNFRIDFKTNDPIKTKDLIELLESLQRLSEFANDHFQLHEDVTSQTIQLSLQSEGFAKLKQAGKALGLAAMMLTVHACETNSDSQPLIQELKAADVANADTIQKLDSIFQNYNATETLSKINQNFSQ